MMRIHNVESVDTDETYLYLTIDGCTYRIPWTACSPELARATMSQRSHLEVSPSGYGIHWPEIDEDLAITPLLQQAEPPVTEMVEATPRDQRPHGEVV